MTAEKLSASYANSLMSHNIIAPTAAIFFVSHKLAVANLFTPLNTPRPLHDKARLAERLGA